MTWPACFEPFFRRLKCVEQSNLANRWYALCPSHDDSRRSLSIDLRDGKLYIMCHAPHGCTARGICNMLGLGLDCLYHDNKIDQPKRYGMKPKIALGQQKAVYTYRDEAGALLYEVVRYEPKEFRQRRPNLNYDPSQPKGRGNSPWVWSIDGVRRVLYKLPELVEEMARRPHDPIYFVEGEKSVECLWWLGALATCSPLGACKFHHVAGHAQQVLSGRRVVVLADDDPPDKTNGVRPGNRHAWEVCGALASVADVSLVRLHDEGNGDDVVDWLKAQAPRPRGALLDAFEAHARTFGPWDGTEPPGAIPVASDGMFGGGKVAISFASRVATSESLMMAKRSAPVATPEEAFGLISLYHVALQGAIMEGNPTAILEAIARLGAASNVAGEGLSR